MAFIQPFFEPSYSCFSQAEADWEYCYQAPKRRKLASRRKREYVTPNDPLKDPMCVGTCPKFEKSFRLLTEHDFLLVNFN